MLWFALFSVSFRSKKLNIFSVLLFVHLELVSIWLAIASRLLFVAISFQVHCCSFPSYSYQQSAPAALFFIASLTSVFHMFVYCAGVEADVPCSSDIQLSPERLGENWEDCKSIHPPLLPIPPDTHFGDPEMVVQAVRWAGKLHMLLNHWATPVFWDG